MDESNKRSRTEKYKSLNFRGTTDWAIDLQGNARYAFEANLLVKNHYADTEQGRQFQPNRVPEYSGVQRDARSVYTPMPLCPCTQWPTVAYYYRPAGLHNFH